MKTLAFILCSLLTTILLSNCGEQKITCDPDRHEYSYVTPEDKAVLPYKGFDTLKLKHSSGEEYTFYAGALDSAFYINAKSTSPDCANNIFEHQQGYFLDFQSSNYPQPLKVSLARSFAYGGARLEITLKKGVTYKTTASLYIPPPPSRYYDFDTLIINNYKYFNIRLIYKDNVDKKNILYYNRDFGILKIEYSNGETFERIP
jgi:hypothetical protein